MESPVGAGMAGEAGSAMKDKLFNYTPPAMIAMVLMFWAFGPKALLDRPWTFVATSSLITIVVLLLEQVHERHSGWRMNRQEFFTDRSEEHTSELQSLMRISYAVFCLKKKKKKHSISYTNDKTNTRQKRLKSNT